ncbi:MULTISPECIES: prenyltransferase/squalene oxidase repeat-containing protein [unclassified Carboxylicivirga]|uniref:prenyltransferase/squalene oxidase repeat-containing protein n=1 Tax=Carboxylicivirga TaxID=1628153 RepID=UPI003D3263A9
MQSISANILTTLKSGKDQLGGEAIDHLSAFVQSQLLQDHSFMNKSRESDLYYTSFGWMLCLVLGIHLDADKMAAYLSRQHEDDLDLIHYAAFKRCELIFYLHKNGRVLTWLKNRTKQQIKELNDFKHVPHQDKCAPYTQFIWVSLLEDTGNKLPEKRKVEDDLGQYRHDAGGFMNNSDGLSATTNATTAALSVLGQISNQKYEKAITYLKSMQDPSGGFKAAASAPVPDLLSTATALYVLKCYNEKPGYPALEFIEAHWAESGGFIATLLDDKSDVEYCFYGLLAIGSALTIN